MKKQRKNSLFKAQHSIILIGVMIMFTLFLVNFASATVWDDGTLVSYFKVDSTSGTNLIDEKLSHNMTGINTPTWNASGKIYGGTHCQINDNEYWNGTNNDDLNFSFTQPHSENFWVMLDDIQNNQWIMSKAGHSSINYQRFGYQISNGYFIYDIHQANVTEKIANSTIKPTPNLWYMITGINYGNGTFEIYVNGVNKGISTTTSYISEGQQPFRICSQSGGAGSGALNGTVDEVGIWNKTLTSAEITELYNSGNGLAYEGFGILVNLISPFNNTQTLNQTINFTAQHSIIGGNLTNATIYLWYSNGTLFNTNYTIITGNVSNTTILSLSDIPFENYVWNYKTYGVNSTGSNLSTWAGSNFTLSINAFSVNSETYNFSTYETKSESFSINISTIPAVNSIGAFLHYNGTAYAADHKCSGNTCLIERIIDIPLLAGAGNSENKSFFWQITFFGSGLNSITQNSTANNQSVTNIVLIDCGGDITIAAVNFTIKNETTKALTFADFKSTFSYYLGGGSVIDQYNYSGSGASSYDFCINNNLTFITNSEIKIQNETKIRNYIFNKEEYTNSLTTKDLFLPDDLASNIIIEVRNQGLVPMANILINIYRFYPDENAYHKIESKKTDEFGQITSKLVESDVSYKFEFYDLNGNILKTSDKITVACRSSICILSFVIEVSKDYFERFENLDLFTGSLLFDNTTNTFTFSWDDQRGESAIINLKVTRYNLNESIIVCNNVSVAKLSTLVCNVGDQTASYTAQVFRTVGSETRIIDLLNVKIGDTTSIYGIEGLLWAFILLFTCIGIGAYNPTAGAMFFGVGFVFLGIIGFISMPIPVFFAVTALTIVFIWAVNT